jgi:CRP-like cAMP-binding protein
MDRIRVSGTLDAGSIPAGATSRNPDECLTRRGFFLNLFNGFHFQKTVCFVRNRKARMNERISVKKQEFLLRPGDVNRGVFFVRKGVLRSYKVDEKGKEHILLFAPEGWMVGDIEAQVKGHPSGVFIQAIEDSEVQRIDPKNLDSKKNNLAKEGGREMSQHFNRLLRRIVTLEQRVMMLLSHSALERYEAFLVSYPDLINRIPQWMIASYIGVTPEALSKARRSRVQGSRS